MKPNAAEVISGICLLSHAIAAPCSYCGMYQSNGVHPVNDTPFCGNHCPQCKPLSHDWQGSAVPVGEQLELT